MSDEIRFEAAGACGMITLNRPDALNALTLDMVRLMYRQLMQWRDAPQIRSVLIEGAGEKSFCAGGDIRALYDWGRAGAPEALDFYREEYQLNHLIKHYPKPYAALLDGIVMGGGVGVSVHGSHPIATPRTRFAMPEVAIGLIPDVGATYFLPRLRDQDDAHRGILGKYIALTGARLNGADCHWAGIASHYVEAAEASAILRDALAKGDVIDDVLSAITAPPPDSALAGQMDMISRYFAHDELGAILNALDSATGVGDWAQKTAQKIRQSSPTSCALVLEQMRHGAGLDFDGCQAFEFRVISRIMQAGDFYEGVRAMIIDKDNAPRWQSAGGVKI